MQDQDQGYVTIFDLIDAWKNKKGLNMLKCSEKKYLVNSNRVSKFIRNIKEGRSSVLDILVERYNRHCSACTYFPGKRKCYTDHKFVNIFFMTTPLPGNRVGLEIFENIEDDPVETWFMDVNYIKEK